MNKHIYITASLYFEISGSELYGGAGSVGYSSTVFGDIGDVMALDDAFVERQIDTTAAMCSVPRENVRLISQDEYDEETADEEDEEDRWGEGEVWGYDDD